MTNANSLKEAWRDGRTAFGLWSVMPGSFGAEVLAATGPDYVCVDLQHGLADHDSMVPMLQAIGAAGATPVARVLSSDPARITKVLDAGALGVIVPLVDDAEEAARAVSACRYPPRGNRSYGPVRASAVIGSAVPEDLDRDIVCLVMVETREGLENVEEIAATPGLDGIYVGPADLALSLGLPPSLEITHPEHARAIERIRETCREAGIAAGIHAGSGGWAGRHAEAGFDMVTVATDASLLGEAARQELGAARGRRVEGAPKRGYS